jgi:hypothetical protein
MMVVLFFMMVKLLHLCRSRQFLQPVPRNFQPMAGVLLRAGAGRLAFHRVPFAGKSPPLVALVFFSRFLLPNLAAKINKTWLQLPDEYY